jgi:phage terminase large subunit
MQSQQSYREFLDRLPKHLYDALIGEAWEEAQRITSGGYIPHGNIKELFASAGGEIVLSGPAGTGKSRGCFEYIHQQALRYPNSRILILRKTRASLNNSGLITYEKEVLGQGHYILADSKTRKGRDEYKYKNGSVIVTGGMDNDTKIMSSQYDLIYVQEATELSIGDWEALTTRMRNGVMPVPYLIGDVNPQSPKHFLHQRWQAGTLKMVFTQHEDNPVLYDDKQKKWTERGKQYLAILDALTGVRKERLRYGRWVASEGVVYSLDYATHFIDRFVIPKDWRRVCSVDFGFHNPFVCGWWAISPDGVAYLYRYIYKTNRLLEDHLNQIKEINAANNENIEIYICDHDSQEFEMMRARGFNVIRAYKDITTGIQAVQARLKVNEKTGLPRIYFMRDSLVERDEELENVKFVCTIEGEFDSYSWAKTDSGKLVKELPVKDNDHAMDMIRYAVTWLDRTGRPDTGGTIVTIPLTMPHPLKTQAGQTTPSKRQLPPAIGRK